jgi:hypothetical protein
LTACVFGLLSFARDGGPDYADSPLNKVLAAAGPGEREWMARILLARSSYREYNSESLVIREQEETPYIS